MNSAMEYGDAVAVIVNDMGAEIDRLRAALETIVQIYETQDARPSDLRMATLARRALAGR